MTKKSSAKHVKVETFSYRRATLRATTSDLRDPAEICRHWSWTIGCRGTKSCPKIGKRYYFDMFRSTNRGGDGPEWISKAERAEKKWRTKKNAHTPLLRSKTTTSEK